MLPYSDITTDADSIIVSAIDDGEEVNWEFKVTSSQLFHTITTATLFLGLLQVIDDKQSDAIREAIDLSSWETSDTLRTRYDVLNQPQQPAQEVTENAADDRNQQPVEGQEGRKREREDSRDRSRSNSFHNTGTLATHNFLFIFMYLNWSTFFSFFFSKNTLLKKHQGAAAFRLT